MADDLMAALQAKLVSYESAGMTEHVKRVKARIAEVEKGEKKKTADLPMALAPTPVPATPASHLTPKKTVKKLSAPKKAPQKRKK